MLFELAKERTLCALNKVSGIPHEAAMSIHGSALTISGARSDRMQVETCSTLHSSSKTEPQQNSIWAGVGSECVIAQISSGFVFSTFQEMASGDETMLFTSSKLTIKFRTLSSAPNSLSFIPFLWKNNSYHLLSMLSFSVSKSKSKQSLPFDSDASLVSSESVELEGRNVFDLDCTGTCRSSFIVVFSIGTYVSETTSLCAFRMFRRIPYSLRRHC